MRGFVGDGQETLISSHRSPSYREQPGGGRVRSSSPGHSQPLRFAKEQPHPQPLRRAPRPSPAVPSHPQEGSLKPPPPPSHRDTWTGNAALQRGHRETAAGSPGSAQDRIPPPPSIKGLPCRRCCPAALGALLSIKPGWLWERRLQELCPWEEGGEGHAAALAPGWRRHESQEGTRGEQSAAIETAWGGGRRREGAKLRRPKGGLKARALIGPMAAVGGAKRCRH